MSHLPGIAMTMLAPLLFTLALALLALFVLRLRLLRLLLLLLMLLFTLTTSVTTAATKLIKLKALDPPRKDVIVTYIFLKRKFSEDIYVGGGGS